jgi:hypothetical protein
LQWQFDWLYEVARDKLGLNNTEQVKDLVHQKLAESICITAMDNCHGEHQQYESLEDCFDFLAEGTPLGDAYQLGFDTVMCRMVHQVRRLHQELEVFISTDLNQNMVPLRPQTHCSHIGRKSGVVMLDLCASLTFSQLPVVTTAAMTASMSTT